MPVGVFSTHVRQCAADYVGLIHTAAQCIPCIAWELLLIVLGRRTVLEWKLVEVQQKAGVKVYPSRGCIVARVFDHKLLSRVEAITDSFANLRETHRRSAARQERSPVPVLIHAWDGESEGWRGTEALRRMLCHINSGMSEESGVYANASSSESSSILRPGHAFNYNEYYGRKLSFTFWHARDVEMSAMTWSEWFDYDYPTVILLSSCRLLADGVLRYGRCGPVSHLSGRHGAS
ncbi:unnamed protein product [Toxocara canis]|uniref:CHAT domain-containing protein n=1 Tax=Toxocara canis TaxID=6265 RepID=A0A183UPJ1_TOXCA|nr:unnamed protein product [Toxocara canis]